MNDFDVNSVPELYAQNADGSYSPIQNLEDFPFLSDWGLSIVVGTFVQYGEGVWYEMS